MKHKLELSNDKKYSEDVMLEKGTSYTFSRLCCGDYVFTICAIDQNGNYSDMDSCRFTIDYPAPKVDIISMSVKDNDAHIEWIGIPAAVSIYRYEIGLIYGIDSLAHKQSCPDTETDITFYNLQDGVYSFAIRAEDKYGYLSDWKFMDFCIGSEMPVVSILSGNRIYIYTISYTFQWQGTPGTFPIVQYQYQMDEQTVTLVDSSVKSVRYDSLAFARHIFKVRAIPSQGPVSEWAQCEVIVRYSKPRVILTYSPPDTTSDTDVNFSWITQDNSVPITFYKLCMDDDVLYLSGQNHVWYYYDLECGEHTFQLWAIDQNGTFSDVVSRTFVIIDSLTVVNKNTEQIPETCTLCANYPNPFNAATMIRFGLPVSASVRLAVYDVLGRNVALLADEELSAGWHEMPLSLDGGSGTYVIRMTASGQELTQKITLLK